MATPQVERRAWRVQEFADAYGLSVKQAYKLMSEGQLEFVQHGSIRLISVEAADRWFQSGGNPDGVRGRKPAPEAWP